MGAVKYRRNQRVAMGWEVGLLLLSAAAFVAVVGWLFAWRFESGDAYPPYSSLRADPLGSKALVESLASLPGYSVTRNYRPFDRLPDPGAACVWLRGMGESFLAGQTEADAKALTRVASEGGRLLIAFSAATPDRSPDSAIGPRPGSPNRPGQGAPPRPRNSGPGGSKANPPRKPDPPKKMDPPKKPDPPDRASRFRLPQAWGFALGTVGAAAGEGFSMAGTTVWRQARLALPLPLPEQIPWRSRLFLKDLDPAWQVVYTCGGKPVVAVRRLGRGELLVVGDSYLFSNEAMLRDRRPELLAWWAGPRRRVVVDETHLGLREQLGVAALGRRYGLQWLLAGLLLLAGLHLWKSARPLVPGPTTDPGEQTAGAGLGRDHQAGLVNLLRRNLPADQLLEVCHQEWLKTVPRQGGPVRAKLDRIAAAVADEAGRRSGRRDLVKAYQAIAQILKER